MTHYKCCRQSGALFHMEAACNQHLTPVTDGTLSPRLQMHTNKEIQNRNTNREKQEIQVHTNREIEMHTNKEIQMHTNKEIQMHILFCKTYFVCYGITDILSMHFFGENGFYL